MSKEVFDAGVMNDSNGGQRQVEGAASVFTNRKGSLPTPLVYTRLLDQHKQEARFLANNFLPIKTDFRPING